MSSFPFTISRLSFSRCDQCNIVNYEQLRLAKILTILVKIADTKFAHIVIIEQTTIHTIIFVVDNFFPFSWEEFSL